MRQSVKLNRQQVGAGPTIKVSQSLVDASQRKSFRNSFKKENSSVQSLGSYEFSASTTGASKAARLAYNSFRTKNKPIASSDVRKEANVELKVQDFNNGKNRMSIRASLIKWKKVAGSLVVGDGCLSFVAKSGKDEYSWIHEVNNIQDLTLRPGKDFSLTFADGNKIVNVPTKDAEDWIKAIFVEARTCATVLNECVNTLLPDEWKDAMITNAHQASMTEMMVNGPLTTSGDKTVRLARFEKKDMDKVELCIREYVDLIGFCRGVNTVEYYEAEEKLAKWLEFNGKQEESNYWQERAQQGYRNHGSKVHNQLYAGEGSGLMNPLDALRNPVGLEDMMEMRVASTLSEENMNKRINHVLQSLAGLNSNVKANLEEMI